MSTDNPKDESVKMFSTIKTRPIHTRTGRSPKYRCFYFLYVIMQIIGISMVVLKFVWTFMHSGGLCWSTNPMLQFNWHPLLLSIGMIYLNGNCKFLKRFQFILHPLLIWFCWSAIIIYRGFWYARKWLFVSIMMLVGVAICAGELTFKELTMPNAPHLVTLHFWLGLIAIGVLASQVNTGEKKYLAQISEDYFLFSQSSSPLRMFEYRNFS